MLRKMLIACLAMLTTGGLLVSAGPDAEATGNQVRVFEVTVTVENLAPSDGTAQTPVWVALHDGSFDLYDRGQPVTAGLESLAEDGATGTLSAEFAASGAGVDTTIVSNQGIPPLLPGESGSFTFFVDVQRGTPQYLSYASMVLPSNDAFIANGDPLAIQVFNERGRFIESETIVTGAEVLDAGTEVNDEAEESTAFFGQAAPNTGITEGAGVELHPGFIADGRILSEPRFQNADFTANGYDALRITTEAKRTDRRVTAELDGDQTVPAVETEAEGWTQLRLRSDGTITYRVRATQLDGLTVAHIHLGAPGETGPVAVDLLDGSNLQIRGRNDDRVTITGVITDADLVGPLAGLSTIDLWAEIQWENAYINLHTNDAQSGEIRADLGSDS